MAQVTEVEDLKPKNVCMIVMSGQAGELVCDTAREMGITPQQLVSRAIVEWFKTHPRPPKPR